MIIILYNYYIKFLYNRKIINILDCFKREQNEVLSKPISTHLSLEVADDAEEFG